MYANVGGPKTEIKSNAKVYRIGLQDNLVSREFGICRITLGDSQAVVIIGSKSWIEAILP